jgi:hypothetical protein
LAYTGSPNYPSNSPAGAGTTSGTYFKTPPSWAEALAAAAAAPAGSSSSYASQLGMTGSERTAGASRATATKPANPVTGTSAPVTPPPPQAFEAARKATMAVPGITRARTQEADILGNAPRATLFGGRAKMSLNDINATNETASRLGVSPADLLAVSGYETIGTLNPDIAGGTGGKYRGLIQFGAPERREFGFKPGMSFADQMRGPVYNYLSARGVKPGMSRDHIYSIVNTGGLTASGKPRYNWSDGNGTVATHLANIEQDYLPDAERLFSGGGPVPPVNVGAQRTYVANRATPRDTLTVADLNAANPATAARNMSPRSVNLEDRGPWEALPASWRAEMTAKLGDRAQPAYEQYRQANFGGAGVAAREPSAAAPEMGYAEEQPSQAARPYAAIFADVPKLNAPNPRLRPARGVESIDANRQLISGQPFARDYTLGAGAAETLPYEGAPPVQADVPLPPARPERGLGVPSPQIRPPQYRARPERGIGVPGPRMRPAAVGREGQPIPQPPQRPGPPIANPEQASVRGVLSSLPTRMLSTEFDPGSGGERLQRAMRATGVTDIDENGEPIAGSGETESLAGGDAPPERQMFNGRQYILGQDGQYHLDEGDGGGGGLISSAAAAERPYQHLFADIPKRTATAAADAAGMSNSSVTDTFGNNSEGLGSLVEGMTLGFGDEISGVFGGVMDLLGGGSFAAGYDRTRDISQRRREAYAARDPIGSEAGEALGALTTLPIAPAANLIRAPAMAARTAPLLMRAGNVAARTGAGIVNAGATGAAYGAAYGAGKAEPGERVEGAVEGLGTGAALGAGAATAARAIGGVAKGVGALPYIRGFVGVGKGVASPEREAARRVTAAIERDTGKPVSEAAKKMRIAQGEGYPVVIGDLGGNQARTRALADSAAVKSPEARAALKGVTEPRFETQSHRTEEVMRSLVRTPANADMTREALQAAAQTARKPFYDRAYREGDHSIWSPELERLASSPIIVDAMRAAAVRGKDRAIIDGFGGFNPGVKISPTGIVSFRRGPNGVPTYPNLQYWDYVKREVDDVGRAARRAGRKEEATVTEELARRLREELDSQVPAYANARGVASTFFRANDALDAGEKAVGSRMSNPEIARGLGKMTSEERTLFREGYVSAYIDKVSRTGDRRSILNSIETNPAARRRTEIVLGREASAKLATHLRVEGLMDRLRTTLGGSNTMQRAMELGLSGTAGGYLAGGLNPYDPHTYFGALMGAAARTGAKAGLARIDRGVAERVGKLLASDDPSQLEKGIALVAGNKNLTALLKRIEDLTYRGALPLLIGPTDNR